MQLASTPPSRSSPSRRSTWHVARDGLVEAISVSALVSGTLGKIGFDIMLMMSTEIGEAFEPFANHRGASSTMPQKRNPISSEIMLANSKAVRQNAGLMLDAMVQDFERASGPGHGRMDRRFPKASS